MRKNDPTSLQHAQQLFHQHVGELQDRLLANVPHRFTFDDIENILARLVSRLPRFNGSPARFANWIRLALEREIQRELLLHEFDKYRLLLRAEISRKVQTNDDAVIEELIQETRMKLHRKSDGFLRPKRAKAKFSTRIAALALEQCRAYITKLSRQYIKTEDGRLPKFVDIDALRDSENEESGHEAQDVLLLRRDGNWWSAESGLISEIDRNKGCRS